MTNTEKTLTTRLNGTVTLTADARTGTFVWRNAEGGRCSQFHKSEAQALRFPPA